MLLTLDSGFFVNVSAGSGALTHMQLASSMGTTLIVWDGPDANSTLNPTGLLGADFTNGGVEDRLDIPLLVSNFSAPVTLAAYTDADNYSTVTVSLPGSIPPDPQATLTVRFIDFVDAGVSGGADFSNIGAFLLEIDGSSTQGLAVGFSTIPEPSTGTLLLFGVLMLASIRRCRWAR